MFGAVGLISAASVSGCVHASEGVETAPASVSDPTSSQAANPSAELSAQIWQAYKSRFLQADGRIVDTYSNVSHTESQGTGMILAALAGDRAAFDLIWGWTRTTLERPDGLFSWRYDPAAETPVADRNNATDGDLMIAWGLALAAGRWNDWDDKSAAVRIARAIERILVREAAGGLILLPGAAGFETEAGIVVNPSYYVFPALRDLSRMTRSPVLARVADDGAALIDANRFGPYGLPADWLLIADDGVRLDPGHPPRFGYEAVRVPLYLAWDGRLTPERAAPFCQAWAGSDAATPPDAWFDLSTGETAGFAGSNGFQAVRTLVAAQCAGEAEPVFPSLEIEADYYSASLIAFSLHARSHGAKPAAGISSEAPR